MRKSLLAAATAMALAGVITASAGPALALTDDAKVTSWADPVPKLLKSPEDVARGRALFAGTCGAYCHKMTAANGDAPFLFDCDWILGGSDQQIFHTITHGAPGTRMVSFKGAIPDADIWRIVTYLKSASQCKH